MAHSRILFTRMNDEIEKENIIFNKYVYKYNWMQPLD